MELSSGATNPESSGSAPPSRCWNSPSTAREAGGRQARETEEGEGRKKEASEVFHPYPSLGAARPCVPRERLTPAPPATSFMRASTPAASPKRSTSQEALSPR